MGKKCRTTPCRSRSPSSFVILVLLLEIPMHHMFVYVPVQYVVHWKNLEVLQYGSIVMSPARSSAYCCKCFVTLLQIGKLSVNKPILATGEDGDWLRVLPESHNATPTMMHAARTQSAVPATAVSAGIAAPATTGSIAVGDRLRDLLFPAHSMPNEVPPAATATGAVARGTTARGMSDMTKYGNVSELRFLAL